MGKKKHLSHDQKRKAKLAKRGGHISKDLSLAYHGTKYQIEELAEVFLHAEIGIYESFVVTERKLTDRQVKAALEKLVRLLREGPLPPLTDLGSVELIEGKEDDLVVLNIRRNWEQLFETHPRPSRDQLIGVLRTTLASIEVRTTPGLQSHGYLTFLGGFLREAGVSVKLSYEEPKRLPLPEDQ